MKVATVQIAPVFKNRAVNIVSMVNLVTEAVANGASLIVLPELATTGYSFMGFSDAKSYAERLDIGTPGTALYAMKTLVDRHKVAIAWGMMTSNPAGDELYNSQVLLYPGGITTYNKINHFGNDFLWMTEGRDSPPIVKYLGKSVGLLICRDVRDKGGIGSPLEDFYEPGDADIVCFSSNFGKGGFPSVSWVNFAKENNTWMVVSNRYGIEEHNDFGFGGVCVIEPSGKVHCGGLKWNSPCIVYADIP